MRRYPRRDSKASIARLVGFDAHFLTRCEHNCLVVFCSRCDLPLKERNYSCEQQLSPVHLSSDNLRNINTDTTVGGRCYNSHPLRIPSRRAAQCPMMLQELAQPAELKIMAVGGSIPSLATSFTYLFFAFLRLSGNNRT